QLERNAVVGVNRVGPALRGLINTAAGARDIRTRYDECTRIISAHGLAQLLDDDRYTHYGERSVCCAAVHVNLVNDGSHVVERYLADFSGRQVADGLGLRL